MSFIKVYVHFTWATKYRIPFLNSYAKRQHLWNHIESYAPTAGIHIVCVSGYADHCHCLVSMRGKMGISETARILKGESSYWINQQGILDDHFRWQREFYAAAIAENDINNVCKYIMNQENHHANNPSDQDYIL